MKFIKPLIITLILTISVTGVNDNLAKEAQSNQPQSNGLSFFSGLFGNAKNQKPQTAKDLNARAIFKGLEALKQLRQKTGSSFLKSQDKDQQIDDLLPYEALLPRRRMPLDLKLETVQKLFGQGQNNKALNPISELISQLTKQRKQEVNQEINWENPAFKDKQNGEQMPFFNIFGKRRMRKHSNRMIITDAEIQSLLIQKIPTFEGGKIIKMATNHYKKGLFLNIEFQDKQNKIFNIIARYRPKKHLLEIVSVKSNTLLDKTDQKPLFEQPKSIDPFSNKIEQPNKKQQGIKTLEQKLKAMEELNKVLQSKINDKQIVQNKKEQIQAKPSPPQVKKQQAKPVEQKKIQAVNAKVEKIDQKETPKEASKITQSIKQKPKENKPKTADQVPQKNILNQ